MNPKQPVPVVRVTIRQKDLPPTYSFTLQSGEVSEVKTVLQNALRPFITCFIEGPQTTVMLRREYMGKRDPVVSFGFCGVTPKDAKQTILDHLTRLQKEQEKAAQLGASVHSQLAGKITA